jgi:hypothetical protein
MKKNVALKYSVTGLVIAGVIGYILASFTELSFWLAFSLVIFGMVVNGLLLEYEDNLPGGFNNPMSQEEIKVEKAKRRKKLFSYRVAFWVIFIVAMVLLVRMLSSK